MSFLRHVGKINDRKVAIIFRELPNEPHMCLLVYTEILNAHLHDALIKTIESDIGQHSDNLADALNRSYTQDGKIILQVLHHEGLLKKSQTSQVIMTPSPNTSIKLEELNKILDEMQQGEAAVKRLAEIDKSSGMQDPADVARRMRGPQGVPMASSADVLDDSHLSKQRLEQATKMELEATGLLNEAKRLRSEAIAMNPALAPTPVKSTKGRKPKVVVEAAVSTTKPKKTIKNVA
ncbi:MAG: hypothetical protein ACOVLB_09105 [Candidatus Nanopelagicus sp.]